MNENLNELFKLCGVNNFVFTYIKEGESNYINYTLDPEKTIIVNISDPEDEELNGLIIKKIEELKNIFNEVSTK